MSGGLSGGTEDNVLTLLIWSEQHASALATSIDERLFTSVDYKKLAKAAITYILKYHRPPREHIRDLVENDLRRKEGATLIRTIEDSARLKDTLNPEYVMAELDRFVRVQTKSRMLAEAHEALMAGDEEKSDEILWQQTGIRTSMTPGIWLHDDNLDFMTPQHNDEFSSGIPALDDMGVRPERGTMMLLIAPKKHGKSWWCVNLGKAGLQYGHSVLHLSLENSQNLTKRRYLQAFFSWTKTTTETRTVADWRDKPTGPIVDWTRTANIDRIALTMDNRAEIVEHINTLRSRPRLLIKEWPSGLLTIPQLNAYLDFLKQTENFTPDMLILDMPDLMKINPAYKREETGVIYQQLRGLAAPSQRNLALCVPTQGSRRSEGVRTFGSTEVSEDWSKVGTADIVLTYNQTEQERERKLARILVDAARDAPDKFFVLLAQDYAIGQFCLDSMFMNKAADTQLRGLTGDEIEVASEDEDS